MNSTYLNICPRNTKNVWIAFENIFLMVFFLIYHLIWHWKTLSFFHKCYHLVKFSVYTFITWMSVSTNKSKKTRNSHYSLQNRLSNVSHPSSTGCATTTTTTASSLCPSTWPFSASTCLSNLFRLDSSSGRSAYFGLIQKRGGFTLRIF